MLISFFVFSVTLTMANCDIQNFYPNIEGNLTKITWDHAVNNMSLLNQALQSSVMMLEADIVLGKIKGNENVPDIPIMAHPPANLSDLSLEVFMNKTCEYNMQKDKKKGIKLDFKSIEAFEKSLSIIDAYYNKTPIPIWLNADILAGPENNSTVPVSATRFLEGAKKFPNITLSIGWTTSFNETLKDKSYTDKHIEEMKKVLSATQVSQSVTFPVRAGLAINSVDQMKKLLNLNNTYTLTIWSGKDDIFEIEKLKKLIVELSVNKTYLDVPKNVMDALNLPDGNSAGNKMITIGIFSVIVALSAYIFGNNIFL